MEIEDIRKELNHLLENVVEHSTRYSEERPIPSLEISFVLTKINKIQENLSVLRHLLEEKEKQSKEVRGTEKEVVVMDEAHKEAVLNVEVPNTHKPTTEVPHTNDTSSKLTENLEQPPIPKLIDALTLI